MAELHFTSGIDDGFQKDLDKINSGINKTAIEAEKASARIDKAFQRAFQDAPDNAKELNEALKSQIVTIKQLEAEYKKAEKSVNAMAPGTQKSQMLADLKKQAQAIEEEKAALRGLQQAQEQIPPATKRISMEIEHMRNAMARMRVEGKQNTVEYDEMRKKIGELGTAYRQARAEQKALTTGATQIGGIINGIQGLMGAYAMGSGVVSLFVKDNEKLMEIQTRMQSIMAVLMGMQQVANTLHSTSAFRITTVTKVTELWNLANSKVSTGLVRMGIGLNAANIAAKALTATLTLGLGTAITAAVIWIDKLIEKNRQAKKEQEEYEKKVVEGVSTQLALYSKLSKEFDKIGDNTKEKQKFIDKYQDSFKELGMSITTVNEAENLFKVNGDAFVESLYLRAEAAANYQMAVETFKEVASARLAYEQGKKEATTYRQEGGRTVKIFRETAELRELEENYKDAEKRARELIERSLVLQQNAAKKLQLTGLATGGGDKTAQEGTIAYYEELIKKKKEEQHTTAKTVKEYQRLQVEIDAYQKSIDALTGALNKDKALENLEIRNQARINAIKKQAQQELTSDLDLKEQLLLQEYKYLKEKEQLTKGTLDKLRIQEQLQATTVNLQAIDQEREERLQKKQEELDEILLKYADHEGKKREIIRKANEDIAILEAENIEGIHAETIKRIMQETKEALRQADVEFLTTSKELSGIFGQAKYQSIKEVKAMVESITSLLSMIERPETFTTDNALGLTEEQFRILQDTPEVVEAIRQKLMELNKQTVKVENSFDLFVQGLKELSEGDVLKGLNHMQGMVRLLINSLHDMSKILADISSVSGNKSLINSASTMERFAKAFNAISTGAQIGAQEGGPWGALIGGYLGYVKFLLESTAELKKLNKEIQADIQQTNTRIQQSIDMQSRNLRILQSRYETIYGTDSFGQGLSASTQSIRMAETALASYIQQINEFNVVTKFKTNQTPAEYRKLTELYPQLIDAQGKLNTEVMESVLEFRTLTDEQKKVLEAALNTTYAIEEAYAAMSEYLSGIFGGVANEVVQAFQMMYEGGENAMDALNESFSNMIEQFTRDSIQAAFLQPYLDEMQRANEETMRLYKDKKITSGELQNQIVNTLGEFYRSLNELQPSILQAYENADRLAEEAGFSRAFSGESTGITSQSTAGMIQQAITEETGSMLVGRLGAIMLSNERMSNYMADGLEYAIQNLVLLDKIKSNTDYLPEIAENTRKTYEKLDTI